MSATWMVAATWVAAGFFAFSFALFACAFALFAFAFAFALFAVASAFALFSLRFAAETSHSSSIVFAGNAGVALTLGGVCVCVCFNFVPALISANKPLGAEVSCCPLIPVPVGGGGTGGCAPDAPCAPDIDFMKSSYDIRSGIRSGY